MRLFPFSFTLGCERRQVNENYFISNTQVTIETFIFKGDHVRFFIYCISLTPFRPEFIIVIFFHYKPRITVAILDL